MLISFFLLLLLFLYSSPSSAIDFLFNGFDPPNITFFDNASLQSCILSVTFDAAKKLRSYKNTKLKHHRSAPSPLAVRLILLFFLQPEESRAEGKEMDATQMIEIEMQDSEIERLKAQNQSILEENEWLESASLLHKKAQSDLQAELHLPRSEKQRMEMKFLNISLFSEDPSVVF